MTTSEKYKVFKMHSAGMGYVKIAKSLNLPASTVKSCIKREPSKDVALLIEKRCLQCGSMLTQNINNKPKKFCNDKCRMQWWNSHRDEIRHKILIQCKCKKCGKDFISNRRRKQAYCSRECYYKSKGGKSNEK